MKLYGTWESREKDLPEKFYAFSDAYLDSAERLCHNLENYFKRYNNLYPGKRFRFDLPFKTEYTGLEPHEVKKIKKELPPQDQIHKYPTDRDGNEWRDPFAFEPISFLKVIEQLGKGRFSSSPPLPSRVEIRRARPPVEYLSS
jgi:hypothetical protein